jgi:hypothetical protein
LTNAINRDLLSFVLPLQFALTFYIGTFLKSMTESLKEMPTSYQPGAKRASPLDGKTAFRSG